MSVEERLSGARDAISVRRVFGDRARGHGRRPRGQGRRREQNGGGGFGLGARPVGVYVIKDGQVSWRPAIDPVRIGFLAVVVLALLLRAARS
jgi:hypothetical protein